MRQAGALDLDATFAAVEGQPVNNQAAPWDEGSGEPSEAADEMWRETAGATKTLGEKRSSGVRRGFRLGGKGSLIGQVRANPMMASKHVWRTLTGSS